MRKILGLNNRADHLTVMRMANQRLLSQQHVKPDPALTHSSSNSSPETGVKHPWTANSRASLVEEPAEEKKKVSGLLPDYHQLFLELPSPTVITGINGKVIGMNKRYSEVTGLQMADVVDTETLPPWAAMYLVHVEKEYQISRKIELLQNSGLQISEQDETSAIKLAVQTLISTAAETRERLEQLIMWAKSNPVQSKWCWFSRILEKYKMLIKGTTSAMRYSWTFPSALLQMKAKCICSVSVIRCPNTFVLNGIIFSYTFLPPATDAQLKEAAVCYVMELRGSSNLCSFALLP